MYKLRLCGSSDFVSAIDEHDTTCYPPGSVKLVQGWSAPCLTFPDLESAKAAALVVQRIEGYHLDIEPI